MDTYFRITLSDPSVGKRLVWLGGGVLKSRIGKGVMTASKLILRNRSAAFGSWPVKGHLSLAMCCRDHKYFLI